MDSTDTLQTHHVCSTSKRRGIQYNTLHSKKPYLMDDFSLPYQLVLQNYRSHWWTQVCSFFHDEGIACTLKH